MKTITKLSVLALFVIVTACGKKQTEEKQKVESESWSVTADSQLVNPEAFVKEYVEAAVIVANTPKPGEVIITNIPCSPPSSYYDNGEIDPEAILIMEAFNRYGYRTKRKGARMKLKEGAWGIPVFVQKSEYDSVQVFWNRTRPIL